jgi:hypothetical protein
MDSPVQFHRWQMREPIKTGRLEISPMMMAAIMVMVAVPPVMVVAVVPVMPVMMAMMMVMTVTTVMITPVATVMVVIGVLLIAVARVRDRRRSQRQADRRGGNQ